MMRIDHSRAIKEYFMDHKSGYFESCAVFLRASKGERAVRKLPARNI